MDEQPPQPPSSETPPPNPPVDFEERWKRARAEFENYKKDEAKRAGAFMRMSMRESIRELLPLFDLLARAQERMPAALKDDPWAQGITRIYDEFEAMLARNGVTRIAAIGKPFDPKFHEAVAQEEDGDTVIEEVQSGFLWEGEVLRPAQVKIGKIKS